MTQTVEATYSGGVLSCPGRPWIWNEGAEVQVVVRTAGSPIDSSRASETNRRAGVPARLNKIVWLMRPGTDPAS